MSGRDIPSGSSLFRAASSRNGSQHSAENISDVRDAAIRRLAPDATKADQVFAAEFALIAEYKPAWNFTGFGSKVPGKGRPGTERISRWDKQFPKA